MTFTKGFSAYADEYDTITCNVDGFTATATLYHDDAGDKPDDRDMGFWPSRDKASAGYVGDDRYDDELAKAERVMAAWKNNEWFFCGIAVTVAKNGIQLTKEYDHALWGIECNYPDSANEYLMDVANELLPEALEQAKAIIAKLCAA